MIHDLPSCRKLLIDLKYKTQKRYAWLNTLNRLPHTPKTGLVWAHLASFIQTAQAVILCARHGRYIALPPLLRTAGECVVNCTLILDQCSDDNAIMAAWMEKRRYTNKIIHILTGQYSAGQIATAENHKEVLNRKLDELKNDDDTEYYTDWSMEKRWKEIGQEKLYHTWYTLLSSDVHSNPEALDIRHCAMIDGQPTLIWCKHDVGEAQKLLDLMSTFIKIADPCFIALSDLLEQKIKST